MIFIAYLGNVSINSRHTVHRILKQNLWRAFYLIEIIVYIHIVQFVGLALETHGVINHQFAFLVIVCHFGCPYTTNFTQSGRKLVETDICPVPVNQIPGFHQYKSPVISPAVFRSALPLRLAITVAQTEHMQIGHG